MKRSGENSEVIVDALRAGYKSYENALLVSSASASDAWVRLVLLTRSAGSAHLGTIVWWLDESV